MTIRELERNPTRAICIYRRNEIINGGVCVELRRIQDGELIGDPVCITDQLLLHSPKTDVLDQVCSKLIQQHKNAF